MFKYFYKTRSKLEDFEIPNCTLFPGTIESFQCHVFLSKLGQLCAMKRILKKKKSLAAKYEIQLMTK